MVKPPAMQEEEDNEQDKVRERERRGKEDRERGIGVDAELPESANMPTERQGMPNGIQ